MASIISYQDVPQASFRTVQLTRPARGCLVENNANVTVTVRDDLGRDQCVCPQGVTLGWNFPEGVYSPSIGCVGSYQGTARVYFYDGLLDLSSNPAVHVGTDATIIGTLVTTNATLEALATTQNGLISALNALITTLNGKTDITNTNTGNTVTNTGNIYTATASTATSATSIATSNSAVATNTAAAATNTGNTYTSVEGTRSNTGLMTNIYAKNTQPFTVATSGIVSQSITYAINTFAVQFTALDNGFLSVYYAYNGVNIYLLRNVPIFDAASNYTISTEKVYRAPIPAGSTVNVSLQQSTSGMTGMLKW